MHFVTAKGILSSQNGMNLYRGCSHGCIYCDEEMCRKIELNVSTTGERFEVLKKLRDAGIPTVVWLSPILPFINDTAENVAGILELCAEAGVYGVVNSGGSKPCRLLCLVL